MHFLHRGLNLTIVDEQSMEGFSFKNSQFSVMSDHDGTISANSQNRSIKANEYGFEKYSLQESPIFDKECFENVPSI